jgi:prophage maintenance system killer protein
MFRNFKKYAPAIETPFGTSAFYMTSSCWALRFLFFDGNKRTAYLVAEAFCNLNDWRLETDDMAGSSAC